MHRCGSSLAFILLFFHHHAPACTAAAFDAITDGDALLSFKSLITEDPSSALASWQTNDTRHFCRWHGVRCGGRRHPDRVVALDLDSLDLAGSISPALSNLTFLRRISLSDNRLNGSIPQELGCLRRLRHLDLSLNSLEGGIPATLGLCSRLRNITFDSNKLQGEIPNELSSLTKLVELTFRNNSLIGGVPPWLSNLSSLTVVSLSYNTLSGGIPPTIGMLTSLTFLHLSSNNLTGSIPPSITNLTSLTSLFLSFNALSGAIPNNMDKLSLLLILDLSRNNLTGSIPPSLGNLSSLTGIDLSYNTLQGNIPPSFGHLSNLTYLSLQSDNLSGAVPPSLWNLSSLAVLNLASNRLSGIIPASIGHSLPNLQYLYMYENQFQGPIPSSLSNASGLVNVELHSNKLSGNIPPNLGKLRYLSHLIIGANKLEASTAGGWDFLTALTNCTSLEKLQLDFNMLGGKLPSSIANLSTTLHILTLQGNGIDGTIPAEIMNLVSLSEFLIADNYLIGTIPASMCMLSGLQVLYLGLNNFSGEIPNKIGNLTNLNDLSLEGNDLSGSIPSTLANCRFLEALDLHNNRLTGSIPKEVLTISSLSLYLDISQNSLVGAIPPEIGSLINLNLFDVSDNLLSGNIPSSLGQCALLEYVYLQGNSFSGTIPTSLSSLKGVRVMDFSRNNFSGPIPEFLEHLRGLNFLNLSFNKWEGEVPKGGIFANASAISVVGNNLCGDNLKLHLPPCSSPSHKRTYKYLRLVISISTAVLVLIVLFSLSVVCYWRQRLRQRNLVTTRPKDVDMKWISYLALAKATDGFSSASLIGVGSFGSVYKGILEDDNNKIVAVKVLNLQQRGASKSFMAECEALRNTRHRNIVKILTLCSSVDFKGDEFKALVYEYMPNGSLENWLHPPEDAQESEPKNLNLIQRLRIAIDVASALDYLHHGGHIPIVHCDLKPSNILLDEDMTAHVGDFGLARLLMDVPTDFSRKSSSSVGLRGSIGYVAPEYGMANRVSSHGDVYSYGILLLEMLTGKQPTDAKFKEGLSIRQYVEAAYPELVIDIIDARILSEEEDTNKNGDKYETDEKREIYMECITSALKIGLSCSNALPTERMEMGDVIREMHAIRKVLSRFLGTNRRDEMKSLSKS